MDEKEVYVSYVPLTDLNWGLITVLDVEEVIAPAKESQNSILTLADGVSQEQNQMIRQMLTTFLLIMGAVFGVICLVGTAFSRKLTAPIHELTEDVAQIDGGNLDYRIHLQTGDEVEELGNAFNKMTEQIQSYVKNLAAVTAEKERIRTEIQVASKLQADMLPKAEELKGNGGCFTLDFGVKVGADANNTIPIDVINKVTGERYSMNVSLAYDGEFGFKAVLSLNMDAKNAGLYANLFYFNEQTGELEFICADEIAADGTAELTFTHASEYTIIIDENSMATSSDAYDTTSPDTSDTTGVAWRNWWSVLLGAVIMIIGLGVFSVVKKKKEDEEKA